jgi:LacI family transcriptional regulator
MRLPVICINHYHEKIVSIIPEDEQGVYEAVKYLQSEGHRRIGVMLGPREYYSTQKRLKGFITAMQEQGLSWLELQGDWTFDGSQAAVMDMLNTVKSEDLPTALFCMSDIMAIGAMNALIEKKIAVPDQISVMGFDNVQQSGHITPRLSTVSIDCALMARLAVEQIECMEKGVPNSGYSIRIPAVLEKRSSVDSAKEGGKKIE